MRPLIASVQRALFNVLSRVCESFDSEQEHRVHNRVSTQHKGERTGRAARHARRLTFDSEQEHRVRSLAWEGASEGKERERLQAARINNWRARAKKNK